MASTAPSWWSHRGPAAWPWLPLAALFAGLGAARRALYHRGVLGSEALPVPVIVVGNVAVGGSGKTPAAIWLVESLRRRGLSPGIVSRGYGGRAEEPTPVTPDSSPEQVGDEPVLLARRCKVPVFVGRDRVAAARALLAAHRDVDVIITDDGLQHYRLRRDIEVVVIDEKILGNRWLLPAGPLREPLARAQGATLVLAHGPLSAGVRAALGAVPVFDMSLLAGRWYRLADPTERRDARDFSALRTRAVAGIGRPQRFFETLHAQGVQPAAMQAYPDHHAFSARDLAVEGFDAVLMTEKDAIKCTPFAPSQTWVLPVNALIADEAIALILERLHGPEAA
ncbi:MAG: tetraacyldisaccharide 4'-kinase [Rhodocyclaceae bacterium]